MTFHDDHDWSWSWEFLWWSWSDLDPKIESPDPDYDFSKTNDFYLWNWRKNENHTTPGSEVVSKDIKQKICEQVFSRVENKTTVTVKLWVYCILEVLFMVNKLERLNDLTRETKMVLELLRNKDMWLINVVLHCTMRYGATTKLVDKVCYHNWLKMVLLRVSERFILAWFLEFKTLWLLFWDYLYFLT